MKHRSAHIYRFYILRADGVRTHVSSHQPDTKFRRMSSASLAKIKRSILAMPHWQKFIGDQKFTLIARINSTSSMLNGNTANALHLLNSTPVEIEIA